MAANRTIVDLRNLLAERFVQPPTSPANQIVTGIAVLDQATGGGLGKGSITEIISAQPNAGSALLIHNLLRVAQRQRFFMALVDGRDSFDVQSLLGAMRKSDRSHQSGRFSIARRKFSARPSRFNFKFAGRIAPHSGDDLVSPATPGRICPDCISGNEPAQYGRECAEQNRAGESVDVFRFIPRANDFTTAAPPRM